MSTRSFIGPAVVAGLLAGCGSGDGALADAAAPVDGPAIDGGAADAASTPNRSPNPTCLAPPRAVTQGNAGLPARLADTGCFDRADPTRPLPMLLPYTVNAPLWSDGAEKDRWLALPDGARIAVGADGDLELPPGSVLIKTFRFGDRRVETRFFVRHVAGDWSGYTYEWNEVGTDAALMAEGAERRMIDRRPYHLPSRAECKQCHTDAAGGSLGLEIAQLNAEVSSPAGPVNQLRDWVARGLFAKPLAADPAQLPALPRMGDEARPLEARARAYLHANCANCHRPELDNSGSVDLRFSTPLAATKSCDQRPIKGSMGLGPQARIVAPGNPELSMLLFRMKLEGAGRMPEVGSLVVDQAAIDLLSEWIRSLAACP